jgi:hypothetical protein
VDTATALCTGNYHFFAAIAKRYPHCVAKIFLPEDYLLIILLGIVQDHVHSVTTELLVASQFHLPYLTKDGSTASFVAATGPHVSMNIVHGLPLITATGMVINIVDNIVDTKYLNCPPFPINFFCTTKNLPAINDGILKKTDTYVAGVRKKFQSAKPNNVSNSEPHQPVDGVSNFTSVTTGRSIGTRWVPPPSTKDTSDDYHNHILGGAGYL